jgi:hypothetical protein
MKRSGLHNRFDKDELYIWNFWHKCLWCGQNKWDAIHHIISRSSPQYKEGSFNTSILNGAPIHNTRCHLYNPDLHRVEIEIKLLNKTLCALQAQGYRLNEKDREFMSAYMDSHYKFICPQ